MYIHNVVFPLSSLALYVLISVADSSIINHRQSPSPPSISLPVLAITPNVESDKVNFYYSSSSPSSSPQQQQNPLLIGNDGSADRGGVHVYNLNPIQRPSSPLSEAFSKVTGRTKVVLSVYGVGGRDCLATFSTPEHTLRFYELPSGEELTSARRFIRAEFSALCAWRSPETNAQYVYLFGKKEVRIYLLQEEKKGGFKTVETSSFVLPIEAETCAIPAGQSVVMFGGSDKKIYTFAATDIPSSPKINVAAETEEEIVGASVYHSSTREYFYLVAFEESISVYSKDFKNVGTINIDAGEGLELSDIAIFQGSLEGARSGLIGYAFESDDAGKGFGISSLEPIFSAFKLRSNTKWNPVPQSAEVKLPRCPAVKNCNGGGICTSRNTCKCYVGFAGSACGEITCQNACSGNGKCIGPNQCRCKSGFTGDDCSVFLVTAKYETEASGADGDDPAIWVAPTPSESRIITTTKSEENPGLSVFDLKGSKLQTFSAEEPNNVDIIYGFPLSSTEKVDLAFAGCRGDNTLCLFKLSSTGLISAIPGGTQTLPEDFDIYGTCVFHRLRDDKVFLFANSKEAQYLQYELTASNNTLQTTLVRHFKIGTGTQPEGCVVDDQNELIFIGEEQIGLWRYGANPEDVGTGGGILVDSVDREKGGKMNADVEGVALIYGKKKDEGFLVVSMQGVSQYNVYERKAPHKFVRTFSIGANSERGVDEVTNTDGVAAVGTNLGGAFRGGLVVVHDDANQKVDGTTDAAASFKLVSLSDVLGKELSEEVDSGWDPREAS